jgi:hypothetical protein
MVAGPGGEPYAISMEARVAVLENIAAQILSTLGETRQELRDFRKELHDFRSDMRTELRDLHRIHDRDFRIAFGATITATVGLAALIAHVAHWL